MMNSKNMKIVGALVGTSVLVGGSVAMAVPVLNAGAGANANAVNVESQSTKQASAVKGVSNVQGQFAYNQSALTSNSNIANVFNKATASLCSSLPDYNVSQLSGAIDVGGNVQNAFSATVDEMADSTAAKTFVLVCACASNLAGGGAIANAEVSGVSLQSVADMAGTK